MLYLHDVENLQVRYLQYDQLCYVVQWEQFHRMAFQGIGIS